MRGDTKTRCSGRVSAIASICLVSLSCDSGRHASTPGVGTNEPARTESRAVAKPSVYEAFEGYSTELEDSPSSFGWDGGWRLDGETSPKDPETVTPADDFWLCPNANKHQVLQLSQGMAVRRKLLKAIPLDETCDFYISFVAQGATNKNSKDNGLVVSLQPNTSAAVDERHRLKFGFGSKGDAYFVGDGVSSGPTSIANNESRLCVMKFFKNGQCVKGLMRTFTRGESITDPASVEGIIWARDWATMGDACSGQADVASIRISVGKDAQWRIADLRIGPTWDCVTDAYRTAGPAQ